MRRWTQVWGEVEELEDGSALIASASSRHTALHGPDPRGMPPNSLREHTCLQIQQTNYMEPNLNGNNNKKN